LLTRDPKRSHYLKIFQENYEAKRPSKMPYSKEPLIPKVMHQIWIGGSDLPPLYQNYLDECKKLHPNWEFKLWGDKEVEELGLMYKDLYDKSRLYPGRTDIIRHEVLDRFGGVYRDMDVKCFRSLDDLSHQYEMYTSLEHPSMSHRPIINTGLLGARAHHPMLKKMLELIKLNIDSKLNDFDNGMLKDLGVSELGVDLFMLPFTDVFVENVSLDDKNLAFPATYFLPLDYHSSVSSSKVTQMLRKITGALPQFYFQFVKPESLMSHNIKKEEILYIDFDIGNGGEGLFKKLSALDRQKTKIFKEIFSDMPVASWSKVSKIPQVINFIVFDDSQLQQLEKNLPMWRMLNGMFAISVWDKAKISEEFPELALGGYLSQELRFLIGLKIIEKFGGHYADFRATPHKPIFELGNKYNFYAGMMPVTNLTKNISLSHKLIGASAHHPILTKALSQIDLAGSFNNLDEALTLEVYKNIYLYGKNIVFPVVYFEPIYDYEESFIKEVIRFVAKIPKPFSQITNYTIVE